MTRTFVVDNVANTFLMDGKPFRYVSGSFHYFRALPQTWSTKLKTMRAAGLNAVDTYVEWALHNPYDNVYDFDGIADIEQFIRLAQAEGFYVILRPGPYICAERDNGGLPFWLNSKYPNIKVRTNDPDYKREVSKWYAQLMPKLQKYLYGNGGPIIMVQIENEYGAFPACDMKYLNWLRDETEAYVQKKALLFTTDIPDEKIACGKIEGVFATTDFGADRIHEIDEIWNKLRTVQPTGPLVNSEFYPGWLTHWQEPNQRRDADKIAAALRKILEYGASVNFYMFFGGTNFGFTAGANNWGYGNYTPDITSYDYDAPMDEAGDPTIKYLKIRNVIQEFLPLSPDYQVPDKELKMSLPSTQMQSIALLLSSIGKQYLSVRNEISELPKSFEELNQFSGLILYEIDLPPFEIDPTLLTINNLKDRALIYIDNNFIGCLSRENAIKSLPINSGFGKRLQILVENQGRINFLIANDTKGIFGPVTIQQSNGKLQELINQWTSISIPLHFGNIQNLINEHEQQKLTKPINNIHQNSNGFLLNGPIIYNGNFEILKTTRIADTYLDPTGWGKGVAYINGFNLGRYWPLVGPQKTLYVPKELLKIGKNQIVLIEYQKTTVDNQMHFTSKPELDG